MTKSKVLQPALDSQDLKPSAGSLAATLEFPDPITVSWTNRENGTADLLLGTVSLAPINVGSDGSGSVALNTAFSVTSDEAMTQFATYMMNGKSFSWRLTGNAKAKAGGLTVNGLTINKVVTLNGFDGLKSVAVTAFDLPDSDATNGLHIKTTAAIMNPSQIGMNMGDVSFNLFAQDMTPIGFLNATGVTITPGTNFISMTGAMKVANSTKLSYMMNTFLLSGKGLKTIMVGEKSSINASWLNSALKTLVLQVLVPSPILSQPIVSNIHIPAFSISMNPADQSGMAVSLSAPQITTSFLLPYAFSVNVKSVQQTLKFFDPLTRAALANLGTDMAPANADQNSHVLTTAVNGGSLTAISGQEATFIGFLGALTLSDHVNVNITGSAVAIIATDAGVAQVALPLTDTLSLSGFQGFKDITVTSTKVVGGDTSGVKMQVELILNNPSAISLNTNVDVNMDLYVTTQAGPLKVGSAVMPNMQLVPGPNSITASAVMAYGSDAQSQEVLRHIMSGYIAGATLPITITGTSSSIIYASLQPVFAKLSIPTKLVGPQNVVLVVSSVLTPGDAAAQRPTTNVYRFQNPLDAPLTLASIKAQISVTTPQGTTVLGTVDYKLKKPVTVMPGAFAETESVPLTQTTQQATDAGALIKSLAGQGRYTFKVDADCTFGAAIGTYPVLVDYQAKDVPVTLYGH
ncbi:hypothetical protein HDU79_003021 [Rhizoclosmatium sp. JEL0117]|nr:hypothetical protein HDU79_003021 [Rhizoclosmatium sp. JEL0117]